MGLRCLKWACRVSDGPAVFEMGLLCLRWACRVSGTLGVQRVFGNSTGVNLRQLLEDAVTGQHPEIRNTDG